MKDMRDFIVNTKIGIYLLGILLIAVLNTFSFILWRINAIPNYFDIVLAVYISVTSSKRLI